MTVKMDIVTRFFLLRNLFYMKDLITFVAILLLPVTIKAQPEITGSTSLPVPDHILIVILEDRAYSDIIGNTVEAPYINALAIDPMTALFTQSFAGGYGYSQPNYLDLYSGCNQGVTSNLNPSNDPFFTENLGRQLLDSGKTFISYSESLPYTGFNLDIDSLGLYARKHNPVANWMGTGLNQVSDTLNQPFTNFPAFNFSLLPTVCYVIPNLVNDMHDSTIAAGDSWINTNLNNYIQWAKTNNSLFILTFDEGGPVDHITTLFTGAMVQGGVYNGYINHFSVLRTIEEIYGLPYICNADTAVTISNCWLPVSIGSENFSSNRKVQLTIFPNPVREMLTIKLVNTTEQNIFLGLYDATGVKIHNFIDTPSFHNAGTHTINFSPQKSGVNPGIYFMKLNSDDAVIIKKIVVF